MADDLGKRIDNALAAQLLAGLDGHTVRSLLIDLGASLAAKDAEIANLRADLKVKQIATDEAMAQGERQRKVIEGLREALRECLPICQLGIPNCDGSHYPAGHPEWASGCCKYRMLLSQSPADLLARREAERDALAPLRRLLGTVNFCGLPDEEVSLWVGGNYVGKITVAEYRVLAALAEQEAKGDDASGG